MAVAWLLTLMAVAGAWAGAHLVRAEKFSEYLAAAGGGLLFGISLFWMAPEIGESWGWGAAILAALGVAGLLALIDGLLSHGGHSASDGVVWPLLAATAVHSFLDGWSVRALAVHAFTDVAVPVGLALHKIPEGAAIGWVMRRGLKSSRKALAASAGAELFTLFGAFVEPGLNASGVARFGTGWTAAVLSLIAGGFFFLGFHAVLPHRNRWDVMAVFAGMLVLVGALRAFHGASV